MVNILEALRRKHDNYKSKYMLLCWMLIRTSVLEAFRFCPVTGAAVAVFAVPHNNTIIHSPGTSSFNYSLHLVLVSPVVALWLFLDEQVMFIVICRCRCRFCCPRSDGDWDWDCDRAMGRKDKRVCTNKQGILIPLASERSHLGGRRRIINLHCATQMAGELSGSILLRIIAVGLETG